MDKPYINHNADAEPIAACLRALTRVSACAIVALLAGLFVIDNPGDIIAYVAAVLTIAVAAFLLAMAGGRHAA
ncbi:hypothetical protein [Burkholderia glumae]